MAKCQSQCRCIQSQIVNEQSGNCLRVYTSELSRKQRNASRESWVLPHSTHSRRYSIVIYYPMFTSTEPKPKANTRATKPKELLSDANAMMAPSHKRRPHNARNAGSIPTSGSTFFLFHHRHHHEPSYFVKFAFLQWILVTTPPSVRPRRDHFKSSPRHDRAHEWNCVLMKADEKVTTHKLQSRSQLVKNPYISAVGWRRPNDWNTQMAVSASS